MSSFTNEIDDAVATLDKFIEARNAQANPARFYELSDQALQSLGGSATKATDDIIERAFFKTFEAALTKGCDRMFREGVVTHVSVRTH